MDEDLDTMSRAQLVAEVRELRIGIRAHRDSTGHGLCWHHPALWALLPERTHPQPTVPTWPEFLKGCLRYRQSLDEKLPDAPRSHSEVCLVERIAENRSLVGGNLGRLESSDIADLRQAGPYTVGVDVSATGRVLGADMVQRSGSRVVDDLALQDARD